MTVHRTRFAPPIAPPRLPEKAPSRQIRHQADPSGSCTYLPSLNPKHVSMANFEIPARTYMSSPLVAVAETDSLDDVHRRIQEFGFSALPVMSDAGRVVGVLSRADLIRLGTRESGTRPQSPLLVLPDRAAGDEMSPSPGSVSADSPLSEAADMMVRDRTHRIYVDAEDGQTVGVVTTRDLMRAISDKRMNQPVAEFMSSPVFTVRASEPVSMATERLGKARITGLVVVDNGLPVGVFSQSEALSARQAPRETVVEEWMSPAILILPSRTPLHRAAAQAASMDVRRIVVMDENEVVGIVTGLDFARITGA